MKNRDNNNATGGGIGLFGILTIIFIILKVAKVIDWPWIWVLAPTWGSVLLMILIILIIYVISR
ncbi:MAG: hypothetical protein KH381_01975 [Clostridium sp.]|nr:hypothetical protein [Clostridium sp.]